MIGNPEDVMKREEFRARYGPVALVTGASSGIGLAIAEELAARGFDLVLTARRTDRLEAIAQRLLSKQGVRTRVIRADLADPVAPARLLAETQGCDIGMLVSNAGFHIRGAFESTDASAMAKMLAVNCNAPMQLAHGFLPRLKARGRGGLIFTASVEGLIGCPYSAAYSASKALVVSLGEGLWGECLGTGVDVLTLCPGAPPTEASTGMEGLHGPQLAAEVARLTLDNLREGPTFVPAEHYRQMFGDLGDMPRREALAEIARNARRLP